MNRPNPHRRAPRCAIVLAAGLLALAGRAWATCDTPEELDQVAAVRALIDTGCTCDTSVPRSDYLRCAKTIANAEIAALRLDPTCRKNLLKCAKRSTCGRPVGLWPCCKTNRFGKTSCKVRLPEQCRSGPGGSHCVGIGVRSCCDACLGLGQCSPPETTSTSTTTVLQDTTTTSTNTLP